MAVQHGARPAGFDALWDETAAELAAVPPDITMRRSPLRSTDRVDAFEVSYASIGGVRIAGWLCVPTGDTARPAVALYPGYGGSLSVPRPWAEAGYAALQISPRGHHRSDDVVAPGFPGLMTHGIESPSTYVYRGMYADCWRAIDVLLVRPEVDRRRIAVSGGSQGGALALVTAAMRPEVAAAAADVPFLTGIRDALRLGRSYPYDEVRDHLRLHPHDEERVLATLDHVDTLYFADRIGVPVLLSVGLQDDICPPATAHALRDRLGAACELAPYPDAGHEGGGFTHACRKLAWLASHLDPAR